MHFPLTSTQCTVRLFIGIPSPFYTLKLYVQINPQINFLCIVQLGGGGTMFFYINYLKFMRDAIGVLSEGDKFLISITISSCI